MFRTTRLARVTVGAIALLAGLRSNPARAADAPLREPHSVVAQSTKETAGTGRRPISQRIAASNLPVRAPSPPDCAQDASRDEALAADVAAPLGSDDPVATEDVDAVTEAEQPTAIVHDATLVPNRVADPVALPPEMVVHAEQPAAAPFDAEGHVDADAVGPIAATPSPDMHSLVMPVAAPAPAAPASSSVRESLLKRIKGALGTRSRTAAPAASDPAAAVAMTPSTDTEPRPAPRQMPAPPYGNPAVAFGEPTLADAVDAGVGPDTIAAGDSGDDAPARLEFDVRESRSLVGEGEQIVMRIAVRNVGGETAERVTATLFFAEGIEPVQAIGQSAEVYPGEVRFEAVPHLSPGSSVDLLVTAVGTRPGSVTYRGELECRQMAGRIAREGAVTVRAKRTVQP